MKRLFSIIITAVLALTLFTNAVAVDFAPSGESAHVHAAEPVESAVRTDAPAAPNGAGSLTISKTYINPLYQGVISEGDFVPSAMPAPAAVRYTDVNSVISYLRSQLVARSTSISVEMTTNNYSKSWLDSTTETISNALLDHTGVPDEGDYLRFHIGYSIRAGASYSGTYAEVTFYVTPIYYTNASQEQAVDNAVAALLKELDLDGKSDYEKIEAVYRWICRNVTYDYTNLNNDNHVLKYTAYAALINRTAVCQGYANLFYRLMLELGVDCRIIAGTSHGEGHAWNIVKLGDYYYNIDSTWGSSGNSDAYFLKGSSNFPDHNRSSDYTSAAFNAKYPMSPTDYDPFAHDHIRGTERVGAVEADCITESYTGDIVCIVDGCDYVFEYGEYSAPNDHTYVNGYCTVCGEEEHEHRFLDGWGEKVDEYSHRTYCYFCGYTARELHSPSHYSDGYCYSCQYYIGGFKIGDHDAYISIINAVEPTCEEYGYTGDTYCTACERIVDTGYPINPYSHDTDENGLCSICGKCLHYKAEWQGYAAPTCTEDGRDSDYVCPACGEIIIEGIGVFPALGHEFGEDGYCWRCGECDHIIPDEPIGAYDPTCTESGYTGDYICERCGEVAKAGEAIPAPGHDYDENDVCSRCGQEKPEYIPGDLNGDGKVNSTDSVLLLRYLAGFKDANVIVEAADFNEDGSVNSLDSVLLLRKLAGLG